MPCTIERQSSEGLLRTAARITRSSKGSLRLLIFGTGVLGTFNAAELQAGGHDVTVLARGHRAVQLRDDGLVVQERGRGCLRTRVSVIETLEPDQCYDYVLVLVLVRNEQVESVLHSLAANKATPSLVFMFNNLAGPQRLIDVLRPERVVLGSPGSAGERTPDGTVMATVLPALIQKTTVGELDGRFTPRVQLLAAALQEAGFPSAISSHMDAWLKTHVALVSSIADAFYAAGGDLKVLANSRFQVIAMLRSIRKGYRSPLQDLWSAMPASRRKLPRLSMDDRGRTLEIHCDR